VIDTGIGIERDKQELIFQAFSQADASTTRKYGGTGLGLTICKELVTLMGGELIVRSRPNVGTVFSFALELPVLAEPPRSSKISRRDASEVSDEELQGLSILVAEDNEVNQKLVRKILEKLGVKVTIVSDGKEAVDRASQEQFSLILMDCQMPGMSGYQATKQIRQFEALRPGSRSVPIIAITANALDGAETLCAEVGMDDLVTKPFAREQLISKIKSWFLE
jgi:CheY-like chemotaxis protein